MDAGPELNKAVSEITGIPLMECIEGDWYDFEPSTNWDDAMEAAERFGLFDYTNLGHKLSLNRTDSWRVYDPEAANEWRSHEAVIASADSGPLAICRAILAISSRTDTRSCNSES